MTVDYSKVPGAAGYENFCVTEYRFSKSSTKRWETAAGGKTLTGLKKNTVYYVDQSLPLGFCGQESVWNIQQQTKGYTVNTGIK